MTPVRLLILLFALTAGSPVGAAEYAAIVIDARNGAILHQDNADARLHPASLTKMMTAYLAFEAVRDGRLKLDQRVTVSRNAAREPPSRIGLKQGQRVRVRDLIRATVVRSANDAATVLAEAIAGSEKAFGLRMTAKAKALGMSRTRFFNAHGLTRNGHLSTARDMAILARHLLFDFPQYYNLFGRKQTPAMGKTLNNTNRLLHSYHGADGIKTGYTRAAGFNLAASAKRGNERVIVVLFGARSSATRNRKVAALLDLGFRKAPSNVRTVPPGLQRLDPKVRVSAAPPRRGTPPATLIARSVDAVARAVVPAAAAATWPPGHHSIAIASAPRPRPRPGPQQPATAALPDTTLNPSAPPGPPTALSPPTAPSLPTALDPSTAPVS
ncbi:MAG: D-alanyl-D-alanine carboxypeptidase family protein, partial [Pseudomonadota bacterium]